MVVNSREVVEALEALEAQHSLNGHLPWSTKKKYRRDKYKCLLQEAPESRTLVWRELILKESYTWNPKIKVYQSIGICMGPSGGGGGWWMV